MIHLAKVTLIMTIRIIFSAVFGRISKSLTSLLNPPNQVNMRLHNPRFFQEHPMALDSFCDVEFQSKYLLHKHQRGATMSLVKGNRRRVPQENIEEIKRILARLDVASNPADMNLPGFRLHPLKGDLANYWAVNVSGNLRIVFRFEGTNARDVDLLDYH